jgi:hypothetical protein
MCNNFKKPTGGDFILECISIQFKILGKTSATLLGGESGDKGWMNCIDGKDDTSSDLSKDLLLEGGRVEGDDVDNKGGGDPPLLGMAGDNLGVVPVNGVALQ